MSHIRTASQSQITTYFNPRLLASLATKTAKENQEDVVVVDEQPEKEKGSKKNRICSELEVENLISEYEARTCLWDSFSPQTPLAKNLSIKATIAFYLD